MGGLCVQRGLTCLLVLLAAVSRYHILPIGDVEGFARLYSSISTRYPFDILLLFAEFIADLWKFMYLCDTIIKEAKKSGYILDKTGCEHVKMELKSVRVVGDCYEPDQTHPFNFMFDTTAINKLAERPEDVKVLERASNELGYEFFRCRIQDGEVIGRKSDGTFHQGFSAEDEKSKQMRTIIDMLPIRKIPCVATFVQRGILLNGIGYLANSGGRLFEVFKSVFNSDPENIEDAIIVESGIRHNCIVISNDREMCVNTCTEFPGRAMWYQRFINETKEKLSRKE